jgi:metal-responsive CopG/Arc/MetJ family transcriptional regulator
MEESKEKKAIIIKGLDEQLRTAVKELANTTGKTMSEIIREAIRLYVSAREVGTAAAKEVVSTLKEVTAPTYVTIKGIGELQLSKEDLLSFKEKVVLMNIDKLEFANDVDTNLLLEKIEKIVNVKELILPKTIPKSAILPKSTYIGKIVIKE